MAAVVIRGDGCRVAFMLQQDGTVAYTRQQTAGKQFIPAKLLGQGFNEIQLDAKKASGKGVTLFTLGKDHNISSCRVEDDTLYVGFQLGGGPFRQFAVAGFNEKDDEIYAISTSNELKYLGLKPNGQWDNWVFLGKAKQVAVAQGDAPLAQVTVPPQAFVVDDSNKLRKIKGASFGLEEDYSLDTNISEIAVGVGANAKIELFAVTLNGEIQHHRMFAGGSQWTKDAFGSISAPMKALNLSRGVDDRLMLLAVGSDNRLYLTMQTAAGGTTWSPWGPLKEALTGLNFTDHQNTLVNFTVGVVCWCSLASPPIAIACGVYTLGTTFTDIVMPGPPGPPTPPNNQGSGSGIIGSGTTGSGGGPTPNPDIGGGSGFIPPGGQGGGGGSGAEPGEEDIDDVDAIDDEEQGLDLTGQSKKDYLVARFVNKTNAPITLTFRWGPASSPITSTLPAGKGWMCWVRPTVYIYSNLAPSCQVGNLVNHVVKLNTVEAAGNPQWGSPQKGTTGMINFTQLIKGSQGALKAVDAAIG